MMTVAVVESNTMNSVDVNDHKIVIKGFDRLEAALAWRVVELNPQTQGFQRCGSPECSCPFLSVMSALNSFADQET